MRSSEFSNLSYPEMLITKALTQNTLILHSAVPTLEFFRNAQEWQYWHQRLYFVKTKKIIYK